MLSDDDDAPFVRRKPDTVKNASASAWESLKQAVPACHVSHETNDAIALATESTASSFTSTVLGTGIDNESFKRNRTKKSKRIIDHSSDDSSSLETTKKKSQNRVVRKKKLKVDNETGQENIASHAETVKVKKARKPNERKLKELVKEDYELDKLSLLKLKPGQKFACPPMGDGTRAFYESLLKERPNSILANKYCIEHGILIGTQYKDQFQRYYRLKELGYFKGAQGGIKIEETEVFSNDQRVKQPIHHYQSDISEDGISQVKKSKPQRAIRVKDEKTVQKKTKNN